MTGRRLAALLGAITLSLWLAGCDAGRPPSPAIEAPASAASTPVAPLAGVQPGPATREPTATTSAVKTEMSRAEQSSAMPMPGQANDHSIPTPAASAAKP